MKEWEGNIEILFEILMKTVIIVKNVPTFFPRVHTFLNVVYNYRQVKWIKIHFIRTFNGRLKRNDFISWKN